MRNRSEAGPWTDDTISRLRRLWGEGVSTAEIGRRLGVSKNAVVGKAHRLDLDARPYPIRREKPAKREIGPKPIPKLAEIMPLTACVATPTVLAVPARPVPITARPPAPAPTIPRPPVATRPVPAPAARCQPLRIGTRACCWPIGEPGRAGFRFCGDPAVIDKPYCAEHVKLAYQPRQRHDQREQSTHPK
jgi:GcrA cell cycle regulator